MVGATQEHWQLAPNIYKLQSKFQNYELFSLPARKSSSRIHRGRPSGGLCLYYHKKIQHLVTHIPVPNSNRVQGISVKMLNYKLVFINVYFPTDPRVNNFNDDELIKTLEDIKFIVNDCDRDDKVILLGDFNTDFSRNTAFVNRVRDFMLENDFSTLWNKFPIDFTHCQTVFRNMQPHHYFSTIDHFFVTENFRNSCLDASVLHFAENTSNHEMIYMKIKCPDQAIRGGENLLNEINTAPNWNKATPYQIISFKNELKEGLSNIYVPDTALYCRSVHCAQQENHQDQIDLYIVQILSLLDDAVDFNIPKVKTPEMKTGTPGWREFVEPIQSDMRFWHSIWVSSGKPRNSVVHNIYKHLRRQYIYAQRHIKNCEKEIRNVKFLEAASKGNMLNILKSLKNQRRTNKCNLPNSIDNVNGSSQISEHFRASYYDIYNVHSNKYDLKSIFNSINKDVSGENCQWLSKITPKLVTKLLDRLNNGKSDQVFNFKSDGLKTAKDIIAAPLAKVLKSFLIHGYVTDLFLSCSLIPLIKDNRKSKTVSSNYRLIAISSLLLKLIDLILLELFGSKLGVSNLQFGFQAKSSTTLCTWTLKETINYFTNRNSPVYLCLLDMTKAFDHVKLDILFEKLRKRIPVLFVRLVLYTYINQKCCVKWSGSTSSSFSISNGVRQGAVISPVLFNLYMDDIFSLLKNNQQGCKINSYFYGVLGYADDFSLLSPSRDGLQCMVNLVKDYCQEHGIKISTNENIRKSKTKCIVFNYSGEVANIMLYDKPLPWVDSHLHLGHTITKTENNSCDILQSRAEFISNIHALYQELGHTPPNVFLSLVQIYFSHFYGAVLWDLESTSALKLYSTWNVTIRNAYDLPFGTHRYILNELSNCPPLQVSFAKRFSKFCSQIKDCKREEILHLFNIQKYDNRSTFGKNYIKIMLLNKDYGSVYRCPEGQEWRIPVIRELLDVQSGKQFLAYAYFEEEEIYNILAEACCS